MVEPVDLIKSFVILLAVVDPIGNIPIYLFLSEDKPKNDLKRLRLKTCLATIFLLIFFFFFGKYILLFFGIRMSAFKLVGAIFLIYIAGAMLSNNKYPFGGKDNFERREDISIIPLTFPLLVGPAAISLVIIQSDQIISWEIKAVIICEFILIGILIGITFKLADIIFGLLGETGIKIMTQFMGLILGSLAIGLIAEELKILLPGLS